ncbi:methionyl-tRNA formyltransferase [Psychromonas sp. RZ22]|uniref:methionyl-tRNA formyltransferase n=1 Tax=Psychromonas algarum TaxID=2555643 RepID=UPI001067BADC|nr:methionyl-tRNA formyltransferase [Psychromonas sp. RZ22]TEW54130.1 methionyl-tRNA formyltransferase [Psychromonas sp. RZ22]
MEKLNIIFAGTPDFAANHLQALIDAEFNVVAVYSQPDRPAGRGKKLTASAVKEVALANDIAVYQPENFKQAESVEQLATLKADLMIVVAYGLILPVSVLTTPRLGCLNVHGSLLPRWRGAAPFQRAIWAGDKETGVTIMQMDEGLDTGDMLKKVSCPIDADETSASLYAKVAKQAPAVLIETIQQLQAGELVAEKQNESHATYAKKLSKAEALINWRDDATFIDRCIRAFSPWPISYFEWAGQTIKVHKATIVESTTTESAGAIIKVDKNGIQVATGEGVLNLEIIQLAGKKAMPVQDVLNSRRELFTVASNLLEQGQT